MHDAILLADGWHGGPGPWILLVPLFWIGVVVFLRRFATHRGWGRSGGWEPGRGPGRGTGAEHTPAPSPVETLNRRYAEGQIDEFEYRERYDLLHPSDSSS